MKKISLSVCVAVLFAAGAVAVSIHAQKRTDSPTDAHPAHKDEKANADCPMIGGDKTGAQAVGGDHDSHLASVNTRGENAMGFSQTETTHHFRLTRDGGVIEVEVKDPSDAGNLERVRRHLAHISMSFAEGDFNTPMLVHDRTPDGVPVMERLKSDIVYAFEKTERGGRMSIKTKSPEALAAVHEFLRFQIKDHQTGDSPEVESR